MRRAPAIIGSAIFLVIAPGTLALYVPWYFTQWHFEPALFPIAHVIGGILIAAGLPILLESFARFALQGLGTPAPLMPPKRLVVTGFYRHVRNPMYVAVTALIIGQGLVFGSVAVLEYGAIVWAAFFLFVLAYEEPALGEQFPEEYKRYRATVDSAHHTVARGSLSRAPMVRTPGACRRPASQLLIATPEPRCSARS